MSQTSTQIIVPFSNRSLKTKRLMAILVTPLPVYLFSRVAFDAPSLPVLTLISAVIFLCLSVMVWWDYFISKSTGLVFKRADGVQIFKSPLFSIKYPLESVDGISSDGVSGWLVLKNQKRIRLSNDGDFPKGFFHLRDDSRADS